MVCSLSKIEMIIRETRLENNNTKLARVVLACLQSSIEDLVKDEARKQESKFQEKTTSKSQMSFKLRITNANC